VIHNLAWLYNVTAGGSARIVLYRSDGEYFGRCDAEIEAPPYGYYYPTYSMDCWAEIGAGMCEYPGDWHTEFYMADVGPYSETETFTTGQWVLEQTLEWELICGGECPGANPHVHHHRRQ
jgi:hypothetical protein